LFYWPVVAELLEVRLRAELYRPNALLVSQQTLLKHRRVNSENVYPVKILFLPTYVALRVKLFISRSSEQLLISIRLTVNTSTLLHQTVFLFTYHSPKLKLVSHLVMCEVSFSSYAYSNFVRFVRDLYAYIELSAIG